MKLFRIIMILALAFTALGLGFGQAHAQVGRFSYMSAIEVQNLDSIAGSVTLTFYNQDGTTAYTLQNDPIVANGKNSYFPLPSNVGDNFNGSVVITSDRNVASISNVHGGANGNDFFASGAYVAQSAGDTTISIPLLMKGNGQYNTWFNVQNAGSAQASVDIAYSDGLILSDKLIEKGAAMTFDQAAEAHPQKIFAATLTSTQPIVVTVIEESDRILYAYNGFTTAATKFPVFPLYHANNSGYMTAINLQNQGNDPTEVTIKYTPAAHGTECTETQTIQPGANGVFGWPFQVDPATGTTSNCTKGQRFVGSAVVTGNTGDNTLVAVVNQWNGAINGGAYNGFNPTIATGKVVLPLVFDRRGGSKYWTSAGFRNVGGVATTITCTFTPFTRSDQTVFTPVPWTSENLLPGAGYTHFHKDLLTDNYRGSASCVANTNGAQIIAIVNELGGSSSSDELLVYEGINTTP